VMEEAPLHVLFRAGQVGRTLTARLDRAGLRVRMVSRRPVIEPLPARYVPSARSGRKDRGAHAATERLLRQVLFVSRRSGMNQSSETAP
jgi:hypothetical protein